MDTFQLKRTKVLRKTQDHEIIFGFEYYVYHNLKLKCGFSTSRRFTPMVWMQQNKHNYIGFEKDDWIQLLTYKEYIQLKLDQYEFLMPDTIIDHPLIKSIKCNFKYRKVDKQCILTLNQYGNKIEFDSESWRSFLRLGIFFTTFLCWNSILQKQISNIYYNHIIPKCAKRQKHDIRLTDLETSYDADVEIDLTRLCFEISKKMNREIKSDVIEYNKLVQSKRSRTSHNK